MTRLKVILPVMLSLLIVSGCATTGTVPSDVITSQSEMTYAVSSLQQQQTLSAVTTQELNDAADVLTEKVKTSGDKELTEQVAKVASLAKQEAANRKSEQVSATAVSKTSTAYSEVSEKYISDQAGKLSIVQARLKMASAWNWRLGISLGVLLLIIILYVVLKIMGKLNW